MNGKFWTIEEDNLLKDLYPRSSKDFLTTVFDREYTSIQKRASTLKIKRRGFNGKYSVNLDFFSNITPLSCYWAGFIAADGTIYNKKRYSVKVTLSRKDRGHLENFISDVGYSGVIYDDSTNKGYKNSTVVIGGVPEWVQDLEKNFNITPRKTFTLQPPLLTGIDQIVSFLVGNIDGDGSCLTSKTCSSSSVRFLGTESLLLWVKEFFDKAFPNQSSRHTSSNVLPHKTIFSYTVGGKRILPFLKKVEQLSLPLLKRKWEKMYANS